ncbi:MAG: TIGR03013 family PEP-CTERM/XrtA system glycosyltransferase [Acidobacteriota bacterium]|nr:TIGR03013 family PEP-CTERM/XrtA system glycosyltransferase [Acidobacteriota bacterium]
MGVVFAETVLLVCCGLIGYLVRLLNFPETLPERYLVLGKALLIAVIFQLSLHLHDIYRFQGARLSIRFIQRLLQAITVAVLFICVIFYTIPTLTVGRGVFAYSLLLSALFIFFWHTTLCFYLRVRQPQVNMLVLGTSDLVCVTVQEIKKHPELGIKVIGFVDDDPARVGESIADHQIIGTFDEFPRLVDELNINHIIVGLNDNRGKLPVGELLESKTKGMAIEDVTAFYEWITGKIPVENLKPSWLIFNNGFDISSGIFLRKRITSTLMALGLLLLTSPLLLLAMILIKLDSKGPVFYKQRRVGQNGRVFTLVKFRSMSQDAEKGTGPVWSTQDGDSRVTRVGRLLRRTRIDELPQIYNVLRGDMNLVGPRPERPFFVERLSKDIPYYPLRHVVKPGITGWAQINYGYANTLDHTIEKLQYDLFYIKNMSWVLDVITIFETVKTVLVRKGS